MKNRVLIVDDEPLARERLVRLIDDLPNFEVMSCLESGDEALSVMRHLKPEVVLLDISMPGLSGMEVAQQIAKLERPPAIIFCTAHEEYAVEAFHFSASGYLLKPVRAEELISALTAATKTNELQYKYLPKPAAETTAQPFVFTKSQRGIEKIPAKTVTHFVAEQKYVTAYHAKGQSLLEVSLKSLETELSELFIRIHRSALANREKICGLERKANGETYVALEGCDEKLLVSRRHIREIKDLLTGEC